MLEDTIALVTVQENLKRLLKGGILRYVDLNVIMKG